MLKNKFDNLNPVIILGSGGHACVVSDCLTSMNRKIIGFTDKKKINFKYNNIELLGNDDVVFQHKNTDIDIALGIGIVPNKNERFYLIKFFLKYEYNIIKVVSANACLSSSVQLMDGVQVFQGATIQANVKIGSHSIINTNVSIDHDCSIGSNCHIAPGTTVCGNVIISDNVFVGASSTIIQGVKIGANSFIPAGSVVVQNVEKNSRLNFNNIRN
jgi:sugar O-acyltransferase (sialic acid O-acetyltransferase NeuD family)